jgi:hypothetical protein
LDFREAKCRRLKDILNEELHSLHSSQNFVQGIKSIMIRRTGHVASMLEIINAYKILDRKPEGKRPLGRYRHKCKDNIKLETCWEDLDWIDLVHHRDQRRGLINTVMSFQVP